MSIRTACRVHGNGTVPHARKCSNRDMLFTVKDETIILNDLNDKMDYIIGKLQRTTSSDITIKLNSFARSAIFSSSPRVKTLPTGLCGVLTMTIFVRGVIARLWGTSIKGNNTCDMTSGPTAIHRNQSSNPRRWCLS